MFPDGLRTFTRDSSCSVWCARNRQTAKSPVQKSFVIITSCKAVDRFSTMLKCNDCGGVTTSRTEHLLATAIFLSPDQLCLLARLEYWNLLFETHSHQPLPSLVCAKISKLSEPNTVQYNHVTCPLDSDSSHRAGHCAPEVVYGLPLSLLLVLFPCQSLLRELNVPLATPMRLFTIALHFISNLATAVVM